MQTPRYPTDESAEVLTYRPDIDGLRAVAVVAVMLFHAGLALPGGFVGVDMFFVVSGYLIIGLMIQRSDRGTFSYKDFWYRRAKRILPAQLAVAFAVLIAGWVLVEPRNYAFIARTNAYQSLFASNLYFWRNVDYFAPRAERNPLLHFWSLAVEEQFYFVTPVLLMPLWVFSTRLAKAAIIAGFILSLSLCVVLTPWKLNASFYLLPTRAWELLLGGLLAVGVFPSPRRRYVQETLAVIGIALIGASFLFIRSTMLFPGWIAALPCLGTAAIIAANRHALTFVGRILAFRPIVWIGLISYSLYLLHWPLLVFFNHYQSSVVPTPTGRIGILLLTIPIAWLSWRWVETPFRNQQLLKGYRPLFLAAALGIALSFGVSVLLVNSDGAPGRYSDKSRRIFEYLAHHSAHRAQAISLDQLRQGKALVLGRPANPTDRPDFLLWGDSHAENVLPALVEITKRDGLYGLVIFRRGTIPSIGVEQPPAGRTRAYGDAAVDLIRDKRPHRVLIVAKWAAWVHPSAALADSDSDATDAMQIMQRALTETVRRIQQSDCKVYLVAQVPTSDRQAPTTLVSAIERGVEDSGALGMTVDESRRALHNAHLMLRVVAQETGARVLDPAPYMFDEGRGIVMRDDEPTYFDDSHLTPAGSRLLQPLLEPMFSDSAKSGSTHETPK